MSEFAAVLQEARQGNLQAANELLSLLYDELRKLAAQKLAREAPGQTLQATDLVHEAWLRLGGDEQPEWKNRAHFFAAAAEAMRRILVDRARRRQALRRGGQPERVDLDAIEVALPADDVQVLAIHEALDALEKHDPAKAQVVKLRYFAGLTIQETAKALDIAPMTAKRHWAYARAWLYREIKRG